MTEGNRRKTLAILNDPPYGTERSYNGLRLANALSKDEDDEVRVFLIGDAVTCGKRGQKTPNGFYNLERMLKVASRQGVTIGTWGPASTLGALASKSWQTASTGDPWTNWPLGPGGPTR